MHFFWKKTWHPNGPPRWTDDKANVHKNVDNGVLSGNSPAPHLNLSVSVRKWFPSLRFPAAFEEGRGDFTAMTRCAHLCAHGGFACLRRPGCVAAPQIFAPWISAIIDAILYICCVRRPKWEIGVSIGVLAF